MSEITISTVEYKKTRTARIDGALYEVRQMGAGDQLDISRASSNLITESRKAMNIRGKSAVLTDAEGEEQTKLLDEINSSLEAVALAQEKLENCYIKVFTPKDEKANPAELVRSIGVEGVNKVIEQIFTDKES